MGQAHYLWERNEESKKKITTLETHRQELESQRALGNDERLQLRNQIKELTEERGRLRQQLESVRAPSLPMVSDSQETPGTQSMSTPESASYNRNVNSSMGNGKPSGNRCANYKLSTQN